MATEYRDYGALNGYVAPKVAINSTRHTQVYTATHDGAGKRLPHMNRSFISFSYGGKNIEDYNLIAITENNQMQKKIYSEFEDEVSKNSAINGQFFWGSRFTENNFSFTLFTDGITEKQLNDFKYWFKPGTYRELILAENPNRAINARISEAPEYHMLPFEEKVKFFVAGTERETSTTMYKGRIDLKFVSDEPFWHSIVNILDYQGENGYEAGIWKDANGDRKEIFSDTDALKMIYEDGVPMGYMMQDVSEEISNTSSDNAIFLGADKVMAYDTSRGPNGSYVEGAAAGSGAKTDAGCVAYRVTGTQASVSLAPGIDNACYFYYPGTAPSYPIIKFTLTPTLNSEGMITKPLNYYAYVDKAFNTITLESTTKTEFKFTLPALWIAYNQAMWVFKQNHTSHSIEQIRQFIREEVHHYAIRNWAIKCLDGMTSWSESTAKTRLKNVLYDNNSQLFPASFTINCKTGEVVGDFQCRQSATSGVTSSSILELSNEACGDMIVSNLLTIVDRNYPAEDGYIKKYTTEHPEYSHRVYHDLDSTLSNFSIQYQYMYL